MKPKTKPKETPAQAERRRARQRANSKAYRERNQERARLSRLLSQRRARGNHSTSTRDLRLLPGSAPALKMPAKRKERAKEAALNVRPVAAADWQAKFRAWRKAKMEERN